MRALVPVTRQAGRHWSPSCCSTDAQTYETFGPFDLPDADRLYTFPVELVARKLRFAAVETNTGNTGAVEIAVYGDPKE